MSKLPRLSPTPLLLCAAALAVAYLGYTSARYVIRNYQLHQDEQQVRREIAQLDRDHEQLAAVRDYLQSDEYVEDAARRTLGLVKPGETLVIVSGTSPTPEATPTPGAQLSPVAEWWKQLFEPSGAPVPTGTVSSQ